MSSPPLENERDPNDELGRFLRNFQDGHEDGHHLDMTLPEHEIIVGDDRRRADRAIWCGLGRLPDPDAVDEVLIDPALAEVLDVSAGEVTKRSGGSSKPSLAKNARCFLVSSVRCQKRAPSRETSWTRRLARRRRVASMLSPVRRVTHAPRL